MRYILQDANNPQHNYICEGVNWRDNVLYVSVDPMTEPSWAFNAKPWEPKIRRVLQVEDLKEGDRKIIASTYPIGFCPTAIPQLKIDPMFTWEETLEFAKWFRVEDTQENAEKYAGWRDKDFLMVWKDEKNLKKVFFLSDPPKNTKI